MKTIKSILLSVVLLACAGVSVRGMRPPVENGLFMPEPVGKRGCDRVTEFVRQRPWYLAYVVAIASYVVSQLYSHYVEGNIGEKE